MTSISERVYALVHSRRTLTSAFANVTEVADHDDDVSPGQLAKTLYDSDEHASHHDGDPAKKHHMIPGGRHIEAFKALFHDTGKKDVERIQAIEPTQEDLDLAAQCGDFGSRPSDLFLKIYVDVLATLDTNPWAGVVSPPLLGSRGVVNLSIISVIPDIMQHYHDCIVNAEHEVFLATNYWEASKASKYVCEAFKELSKRAEKRGKKVVVKMIYDRANLKMLTESHVLVEEKEWLSDEVKLPRRSEMPWLDFELVNFHHTGELQQYSRPREHGDDALLSWFRSMHPRVPLLDRRPFEKPEGGYKFGMENDCASIKLLDGRRGAELYHKLTNEAIPADATILDDKIFVSGKYQTVTEHLNADNQPNTQATIEYELLKSSDDEYLPHSFYAPHGECPMVLLNRAPYGQLGNPDNAILNPQDAAWLAALKYAKKNVFIQSPTFNAEPVVEGVLNAVRRGIECTLYIDVGYNDGGEVLPGQGGINEEVSKQMFAQLNEEEKERLRFYWYTGKDQIKPINAHLQKRNCHVRVSLTFLCYLNFIPTVVKVKLMIIDDAVGIAGNGNQDTQSWYHSQEVNVMIDNAAVCKDWRDTIRRVQNTHLHELQKDGIYLDKDGNPLTDSTGVTSGLRGIIKGVQGSIARARGKGGF
ncbi:hypothetical protein JVU11DRAFT_3491 [Chiua virens]|nr:hypothetical protein JVU11DRAFT_3491 [Chiua virens]